MFLFLQQKNSVNAASKHTTTHTHQHSAKHIKVIKMTDVTTDHTAATPQTQPSKRKFEDTQSHTTSNLTPNTAPNPAPNTASNTTSNTGPNVVDIATRAINPVVQQAVQPISHTMDPVVLPVSKRQLEFSFTETPSHLRLITKILDGVLTICTMYVHPDPAAPELNSDGSRSGYISVRMVHPSKCSMICMKYTPLTCKVMPQADNKPVSFNMKLEHMVDCLRQQITPNDYSLKFCKFQDDGTDLCGLEGTFKKAGVVRRRTIALVGDNEPEMGEMELNVRWRIALPLKLFKAELATALKSNTEHVSFEYRRDSQGRYFFGILQDNGALWQRAPCKTTVDDNGNSLDHVEFLRHDTNLPANVQRADQEADVVEMDSIDFSKLEPVFTDMKFLTKFLHYFVDNIDPDFVTLLLCPDQPDGHGNMKKQPCLLQHTLGADCSFTFMLAQSE